jgi:hypothetical protein
MLFAYVGPETMMPVASLLAAGFGLFMMFGRKVVSFGRGLIRSAGREAGGKLAASGRRDIASLKQASGFASVATAPPSTTPEN